ncbi:MAG: LPS export ABC transporter ATP-binding protein [Gammaproteobacteria bacterium]|nr:LPS export ABC transporter ATP-binding protein [Gammaproteobacteria bacterium]MYF37375.1 LPS export ABC transporter ATP-binding protein [Gammaproteobacteria bacterium]
MNSDLRHNSTGSSATTLVASGISKRYGKRLVVENISLSVATGEIVGLLGPNGAGKTTSFYCIVGLIRMDTGQIHLGDVEITGTPMHQRARAGLGYLPQEASVFRRLTTYQNILTTVELHEGTSRANRRQRVEELIEEFNLDKVRNNLGERLSGGERRRLEIARALASQPKFILLDEPFAGVDPISVADIKHNVRHLTSRGIGVLITDHNVRDTLDLCDRAYIVNEGHVIAEGTTEEILANEEVQRSYLGTEFKY